MKSNDLSVKNDAGIVQEFKPSLAMEKWLDVAIDLASDSPTEISSESGLSKTNWYEWLKKPGFEDWYYLQYQNKRRRWLPTLDKIGMTQAKKGEYNFWKDMNKKAGENTEDTKGTQVNIINAIGEQKKKYNI